MDLKVRPTITLHLSNQEFRLVGLALAGKIVTREDQENALTLNAELTAAYAHQLGQTADVAAGAARQAKAIPSRDGKE